MGDWTRRHNLFLVPEERPENCPQELAQVQAVAQSGLSEWDFPHSGVALAVTDPLANAVHVALLRQRSRRIEGTGDYLATLRNRLLEEGPTALDVRQQFTLLWDADSLRWLHKEFWSRPTDRLHPWWQERLAHATKRVGQAAAS